MKRYIKPISHFVKFHSESCLMADSIKDYIEPTTDDEELGARRKEFGTSSSWDWQDED